MLKADNIHKSYDSGKRTLAVLKGVSLEVNAGEFVAITGPSGAGKSTLLHILGGLDSPAKGHVLFDGDDIYKLNDSALGRLRNKKIGFVFQFYHLLSEFTVLENVLMPALISYKLSSSQARKVKEDAVDLLKEAGLKDRMAHFPNQLSGGEKQRAAVVRGLINKPQLLLCDEPTGNLDSKTGGEVISLIKKMSAQNHMSVALVTHNAELAKSAGRVYRLRDGVLED